MPTTDPALADTIPPPPPSATRPLKSCGCGRSFNALEWRDLRLVCFQDDFAGGLLELRDCPCGSTISIEVPPMAEDIRRAVARTLERMRTAGIEP